MPDVRELQKLNYDKYINPGLGYAYECKFCLSRAQATALMAAIEAYQHTMYWYSPTDQELDSDLIDAFVSDVERKLMACNDVYTTRITESGTWQVSYDGGVTWNDSPGSDPRYSIPVYDALAGGDGATKRCVGANSIVTRYKSLVAQISDSLEAASDEAAVTLIVLGFLLLLGFIAGPWIYVILGPLITAIVAEISSAAWDAAFDEDFWQQFICILYEQMEDDASYTFEDWAAVLYRVQDEMDDDIARHFTELLLKVLLHLGLTNLARTGAGGEMSCDCGCDWSTWEATTGTITEQDSSHIVIVAEEVAGKWYAGIRNVYKYRCCCDVEFSVVGVEPNVIGYVPCGFANEDESNESYTYTGQDANRFDYRSDSGTFTLTITGSSDCE